MRTARHLALAVAVALTTGAIPAAAQPAAAPAAGIGADLATDVEQLERKMMALARAIPADKYRWRPAPGTRTVGEVLLHVASDNWLLPAMIGHAPDPTTGIRGDDYKTAAAFEKRAMDREATIAALEKSFAHLRRSLGGTTGTRFAEPVAFFGQQWTVQRVWVSTTTHLHEHLGQLIVYARSNGVVPPWSQGG